MMIIALPISRSTSSSSRRTACAVIGNVSKRLSGGSPASGDEDLEGSFPEVGGGES